MDQEKIGKFIKNLRIKNNLTQNEFANSLGISYQAVSKWETGRNIPDIEILKTISEIYDVDIEDILNGESTKKKNKKYIYYILAFILPIIILPLIIFKIKSDDSDFNLKELYTTCSEFKIQGAVAYDKNKSSLYIKDIEYCLDDNEKYKSLNCTLYEQYGNTVKEIAQCNKGNNETLKEYLEKTIIKVDEYKQVCSEISNLSLYLEINVSNGDILSYTYKIPLKVLDDCE